MAPDWRWMLAVPDSPRYPTMRPFRQTKYDAWHDVSVALAWQFARKADARHAR
jgi:hypothetical protein